MAGDCTFTRVPTPSSDAGSRVYALAFASSHQKYFFWLQDLAAEVSDAQIDAATAHILSGAAATVPYTAPSKPNSISEPKAAANVQLISNALQEALRNAAAATPPTPTLKGVLSAAEIAGLWREPAIAERLQAMLPSELRNSGQNVAQIAASAPFAAAVAQLDEALRSGACDALIASLGLDPAAGGPFGGVRRLLAAVKHKAAMQKQLDSAGNDSTAAKTLTDDEHEIKP